MERPISENELTPNLKGATVMIVKEKSAHYRSKGRVTGVDGEYVKFETEHLSHRTHYSELVRVVADEAAENEIMEVTVTGTWTCSFCGKCAKEGHVCDDTPWTRFENKLPPEKETLLIWLEGKPLLGTRVGHYYYTADNSKETIGIDLVGHWHLITEPAA